MLVGLGNSRVASAYSIGKVEGECWFKVSSAASSSIIRGT